MEGLGPPHCHHHHQVPGHPDQEDAALEDGANHSVEKTIILWVRTVNLILAVRNWKLKILSELMQEVATGCEVFTFVHF